MRRSLPAFSAPAPAMPWAREEADSDSFDPAWLDETRPSVDVRFDDDTRDGAVRLRIFARLAASYSGGAQPVSGELRRVLSTAERCVADDPSSASDVAVCDAVVATAAADAGCAATAPGVTADDDACAAIADLSTAAACEAVETAQTDDGDAKACSYTAATAAESLEDACATALGSGSPCSYIATKTPAEAMLDTSAPFGTTLLRPVVFSSVDLARREHWAQVFAEFYVLPAERPCVLRLQLGGGATTRFSGLHVGRPGPQVNVAFGMAVSSSGSQFFQQAERVLGRAVSDQVLTNGMMDDQWFFRDYLRTEAPHSESYNTPEVITITVQLNTVYTVCAFRAVWLTSSDITEWAVELYGGTSPSGAGLGWRQVLHLGASRGPSAASARAPAPAGAPQANRAGGVARARGRLADQRPAVFPLPGGDASEAAAAQHAEHDPAHLRPVGT